MPHPAYNSVPSPQGAEAEGIAPAPATGSVADLCLMSPCQRRLWLIDRAEGPDPAYNLATTVRLTGRLDHSVVGRCLNELVERHEALRTTFRVLHGQPLQVIHSEARIDLPVVDITSGPRSSRTKECERLLLRATQEPFDLTGGPLIRALLICLGREEHILHLTLHHAVGDGRSTGILIRELAALYNSSVRGKASPLAELPVQYADFTLWQREWLRGPVLDEQLAYWRNQLAGAPQLPAPPSVDAYAPGRLSARHVFRLTRELTGELDALSERRGVPLFVTLLAAFYVLLYRHTGQADLLVGMTAPNRPRPELEGVVGPFVNVLVLRTDLAGPSRFDELLTRVSRTVSEARAHQDVPFERLLEELYPERMLQRSPLAQAMFVFRDTHAHAIELPGLTLTPTEAEDATVKCDLRLSLAAADEGLDGSFEFDAAVFDRARVESMSAHFRRLLQSIAAEPGRYVDALDISDEPAPEQPALRLDGAPAVESPDGTAARRPATADYHDIAPAQRRLWVLYRLAPEQAAYNMAGAYVLEGEIDRRALAEAFETLIARHEVLRTTFCEVDGEPRQKIHGPRESGFTLGHTDLRHVPDNEAAARLMAREEAQTAFDLERGPLLRARLIELDARRHLFLCTMHHIISDGWSKNVLVQEVLTLYTALKQGRDNPLPPLRLQYKDYAVRQAALLAGGGAESLVNYWVERLGDVPPPLPLPFDFARAPVADAAGGNVGFEIEAGTTAKLLKLAAVRRTTPFAVLFAAYNVLLYHLTRRREIVLGTSVAGRNEKALESLIGFFVNTLAVRSDLNPQRPFDDFLKLTHRNLANDFKHQDLPFDLLLPRLNVRRDPSVSPVFQARFVFNNFNFGEALNARLAASGLRITEVLAESAGAKFDLSTSMMLDQGRLTANIEYRSDLFRRATVERIGRQFGAVLRQVAEDPGQLIERFEIRGEQEQQERRSRKEKMRSALSLLKNNNPLPRQ